MSSWLFIDWILARKEEGSFSHLLGSAVVSGHENCPFWFLNSVSLRCLLIFYKVHEKYIYIWTERIMNLYQLSTRPQIAASGLNGALQLSYFRSFINTVRWMKYRLRVSQFLVSHYKRWSLQRIHKL